MRRRTIFLIAGISILFGLVAAFRVLSPRLATISPANGTTGVLPQASISLTFSRPMQPDTIPERLASQPARAGTFSWQENTLTFMPEEPWPTGQMVTITLAAGAQSNLGLPLIGAQSWSFRVSNPLLAYLWPVDGPANLYALDPLSGETEQLVSEPGGILDYDITIDGTAIYYSTRNNGMDRIRRLDRLTGETSDILRCLDSACKQPRISPQGDWLAYERTARVGSSTTQVWLFSLSSGGSTQVSEADHYSERPFWSSTGLLTYYDRNLQAFVLYDPEKGEEMTLPNETGETADWLPDGSGLVLSEIEFWGEGPSDYLSHLWLVRYPSNTQINLSLHIGLEDIIPMVSPAGTWIAFGRKYLAPEAWTPGHQLWLMRLDGTDPHPLTSADDYNHTDFAWHPTGESLAFVRFNQVELTTPPEIWLIAADGSGAVRLVINAFAPQWIP